MNLTQKANERYAGLQTLRNEQRPDPVVTGNAQLDDLYIPRKGYPLFVAGAPHHGKSLFLKWLLTCWSERHDWKHFVYMGEEGSVDELILDFCELYVKKPARRIDWRGKEQAHMSDTEFEVAVRWVNEHFTFFDGDAVGDSGFTPDLFYNTAADLQVDTTTIDPWNDVARDLRNVGGREDVWLTEELRKVRLHSAKHDRVDIICNHIAKLNADATTLGGKRYQKPALPQEWAGGQAWYRRAFTMLLVYRPPVDQVMREGEPIIVDGETWVINQKSKPKGTGRLGTAKLKLNRDTNHFEDL